MADRARRGTVEIINKACIEAIVYTPDGHGISP
jgi:hypothetical protein